MEVSSRHLGVSWGLSGTLLEASWRPLGGLLGASRGPLGGLLAVLEGDFDLGIILEGSSFSGGPSWRHLGSFFGFFEAILELILELFRRVSSQQIQYAKCTFDDGFEHFGTNFLDFETLKNIVFYGVLGSWRPFCVEI